MILVTGGLGFIGSHTVVELVNNNHDVIIVDDLSNSKLNVLDKIYKLCDKSKITFLENNILDTEKMEKIFDMYTINTIIHFAAFKAVAESIAKPLEYYNNNVNGTIQLLKLCQKHDIKGVIFSSSATVYGNSKPPLFENSQTGVGITNPYGQSKFMVENILQDFSKSSNTKIISLRYFNPVGAHPSGLLGDDPNGIPNNLMPYLLRVAIKNNIDHDYDDVYKYLNIFGNDYDTPDGTGVRDFIHVVDLAQAHVSACNHILNQSNTYEVYNIGTGKGTSVLELVKTFEFVNNVNLPYKIKERRPGDLDTVYCNCDKANKELLWYAKKSIENICEDSYNFVKNTN